ncbi:hypothetical protein RJT34_18800 [Clitoria ternatea]|uniref:Uncharacterized protein n=1 Tax=Clitoria ternatea TaxID=43366 RepID=A0AAN9JCT9_CLITE
MLSKPHFHLFTRFVSQSLSRPLISVLTLILLCFNFVSHLCAQSLISILTCSLFRCLLRCCSGVFSGVAPFCVMTPNDIFL